MSSIARAEKFDHVPVQPHLAEAIRRVRPVAAEDDDEVLGEPFPHLGGKLSAGMVCDGPVEIEVDRAKSDRISGVGETRHMRQDFLELRQKLRPVMIVTHDMLEDDLLDGEPQFEQLGDPAPAIVRDAQAALSRRRPGYRAAAASASPRARVRG